MVAHAGFCNPLVLLGRLRQNHAPVRAIGVRREPSPRSETMETTQSPPLPDSSAPRLPGAPQPRHLAAGAGASFWGEAWRIFSASPGAWIVILIVYVLISIGLAIIPVVGNLAHLILTPVFIGGVMLGCQALARGEPLSVAHLFEGFQSGRFGPLAILG